jgi:integrase
MPKPRPRTRKDGSACWQVRFRVHLGGRPLETSQTFDDHKAADRFARLIEKVGAEKALEILAAQQSSTSAPLLTVSEALGQYIDQLTGIEDATRKRYRRFVANDIDDFMGYLPLEAFDTVKDGEWVNYLEQVKGNGGKTIGNKHGFLSAAMGWMAGRRPTPMIAYNPCAGRRLPRHDAPDTTAFEPGEYELFYGDLPDRWRVYTDFLLASMARPGECNALLVGDIDRETGGVRITKAYKYDNGRLKLGPPKSQRGIRTTYVPLGLIDKLDLDRPADAPLFATQRSTPISVGLYYKKAWAPTRRKLLILDDDGRVVRDRLNGKHVTPYTLRHTGITWRLLGGVPLYVVSRLAGHESVTTTDRRYGHVNRKPGMDAAEVFAAHLPRLHGGVIATYLEARRQMVREGDLGEVSAVPGGFEAVWMDSTGAVMSQVFVDYDDAVDHVARCEAGQPPVMAA